MKEIERIIKAGKEEFDIVEPSEGHFDRFRNKLKKDSPGNLFIMKFAAMILAGIFISAAIWIYMDIDKNNDTVTEFTPEIQQTIYYYNSLNWEMESRIMEMPIDDKKEKKKIKEDLDKYEENYNQLINDMLKYPNDERVINAVIEYHRSKSEMLEHIIEQLNQQRRI